MSSSDRRSKKRGDFQKLWQGEEQRKKKKGGKEKKLRRAFFCHRESLMSLFFPLSLPLHSRTLPFLGSLYYVPTTLFSPIHPKIVPWAQPKATALFPSPFVLRFQFIFQYLASFLLIPPPPISPTNSQKRLLGGRSMGDFLSEVGWGRTSLFLSPPPLPLPPPFIQPATLWGRGWRGQILVEGGGDRISSFLSPPRPYTVGG